VKRFLSMAGAAPLPARRLRKRRGAMCDARYHWPVSGLATDRPAFPRIRAVASTRSPRARFQVMKYEAHWRAERVRDDLQLALRSLTVAGAAQVGSPRRGFAPCFPFDCARSNAGASTKSAASLGAAPQRVKQADGHTPHVRRPLRAPRKRRARARRGGVQREQRSRRDLTRRRPFNTRILAEKRGCTHETRAVTSRNETKPGGPVDPR